MPFKLLWTPSARKSYVELRSEAQAALMNRKQSQKKKSSRAEGLFKQVNKCIRQLVTNPKHPGLQTHEFDPISHPYGKHQKVFEAYAQQKTPGAYRVFWCYGPGKGELTIIAILPIPEKQRE